MLKRVLGLVSVMIFVLAISGCEEKSEVDKAKDSAKNAWEHTKKAVNDATK